MGGTAGHVEEFIAGQITVWDACGSGVNTSTGKETFQNGKGNACTSHYVLTCSRVFGGWADGFLVEGYEVWGYDIEAHDYGTGGYPGKLILRDVRSIHGAELKDATCIVGSSPCQEFSYRAMPWKRAKALPPPYLGMELFNAQFRIQREASEAAGRHIPMVCENVRGAQKWVGRAAWHLGSFYLWGDVPALMPQMTHIKAPGQNWNAFKETGAVSAHWRMQGVKPPSVRPWGDGIKQPGLSGVRTNGKGDGWFEKGAATHGSKSSARKAASALIAKIPFVLAQHIARCFRPEAL